MVYPNPDRGGKVNSTLLSQVKDTGSITLTTVLGARVVRKSVAVVAGENTFQLATAGLSSGLYMVAFEQGKTRVVQKVYVE